MKKKIKLISINIFVFFIFILIIDFISLLILDTNRFYNKATFFQKKGIKLKPKYQKTTELAIYNDSDWIKTYFKEIKQVDSKYYSYYGWRRLSFKGITINIDNQGVRLTNNNENNHTLLPKVVFLGGSTIWGTGVNDNNTIPSLFSTKIKKYHVLNYGESGYRAYQSYQFLQIKIIEGLNPELVISYSGVNNSPFKSERFLSTNRETQIANELKGVDKKSASPTLNNHLLKPTKILLYKIREKFSKKSFSANLSKVQSFTPEKNKESAVELLESWLVTKQLCKNIGADYICILQPNALVGQPNVDHLPSEFIRKDYTEGFKYYNDVYKLLETEKFKNLKENFLDLTNVFDSVTDIYIDFCHVSPKGNDIIANNIIKYLENKSR